VAGVAGVVDGVIGKDGGPLERFEEKLGDCRMSRLTYATDPDEPATDRREP
jgi:hypothetical protein